MAGRGDPLRRLARWSGSCREMHRDTRWVGYIGYDLGRWFEKLPVRAVDDVGMPLFAFTLTCAGRR